MTTNWHPEQISMIMDCKDNDEGFNIDRIIDDEKSINNLLNFIGGNGFLKK